MPAKSGHWPNAPILLGLFYPYEAGEILAQTKCLRTESTRFVIVVKLREMMERYRYRTGERLTYEKLAQRTGLSRTTLEALASRPGYNTTVATIEKLCIALECEPRDLLERIPDTVTKRNTDEG